MMAAVLLAALPALATAEEHGCSAKKAVGMKMDPKVKSEIQKLELKHKLATIDLRVKQGELEKKMMSELLKEKPSKKKIDSIFSDMMEIKEKLHKIKIEHLLAVKELLPPEQWKGYLVKQHMKGRGCGHENCCGKEGGMKAEGCDSHMKAEGCGAHMNKGSAGCGKGHEGCEGEASCVKIRK